MSYMTYSSQEKALFQKRIPLRHLFFLLCSCFRAHPTTLLLKILGGPMHEPSPHLKFFLGVPPVPPRSSPLFTSYNQSVGLGLPVADVFSKANSPSSS